MSRIVRKPAFCKCKNKDADQLRGDREADQRLCFCYTDSAIPLLPNIKPLAIFYGCTALFVWDQVKGPENRFSNNEAHIVNLGFTGVNIVCVFSSKQRLWVLVITATEAVLTCTHDRCLQQK